MADSDDSQSPVDDPSRPRPGGRRKRNLAAVVAVAAASAALVILLRVVPSPDDRERAAGTEQEATVALYDDARLAAKKARRALADAITAKGARHAKQKMEEGNVLLDRGNELMGSGQGRDAETLREAIQAFEAAEQLFADAQVASWQKEQDKPESGDP